MPMVFQRPVGAHGDVHELEYVMALLQTSKKLTTSVSTKDLAIYMASRHGVSCNRDMLKNVLELAGRTDTNDTTRTCTVELPSSSDEGEEHEGDAEIKKQEKVTREPDVRIDLLQLTSMLLIPELREAQLNQNLEKYSVILERVLRKHGAPDDDHDESLFTAENLVHLFFHLFGENLSTDDPLVQDMINVAEGSLATALTGDISDFSAAWRENLTTPYDDAMTICDAECKAESKGDVANEDDNDEEAITKDHQQDVAPLDRVYTAPSIDFAAETFKRPSFVMCLWSLGIALYASYVYNVDEDDWNALDCSTSNLSEVGCIIAKGVLIWVAIFIQISILGTAYVLLASVGNTVRMPSLPVAIASLICSMFFIAFITFGGFYTSIQTDFFDTGFALGSIYALTAFVSLIIASLMLLTQIFDMIFLLVPTRFIERFPLLNSVATPATLKSEAKSKQSGHWKILQLVNNAMKYHEPVDAAASELGTSKAIHSFATVNTTSNHTMNAMVRYQLDEGEKEPVGGIMWAWRKILNGSLRTEEGIWLHGRLWACNFAQLFNVILIAGAAVLLYTTAESFVYGSPNTSSKEVSNSPTSELLAYPDMVAAGNLTREEALIGVFDLAGNLSISPSYMSNYAALLYGESSPDGVPVTLEQGLEEIVGFHVEYGFDAAIMSYAFHRFYFTFVDPPFRSARAVSALNAFNDEQSLSIRLRFAILRGINQAAVATTDFDLTKSFAPDLADLENQRSALSVFLNLNLPEYLAVTSLFVVAALCVALYVALLYVPSYISTVLQFRSGVIPSLRDPYFEIYRKSLDVVTILFGSAFWGTLFASLMTGFVFGGVVLLLIKTCGTSLTRTIAGQAVGFGVIMAAKTIILMLMRLTFFSAFYRKKPAGANIFHVVMEVWNVALAVGVVTARAGMFIVCSVFFIARIDTPFLAPGVGRIAGVELDSYPVSFRKDLLLHEAHRHPYIERLGMLLLLKLRLGSRFGRNPHACWRLLFTVALCPWLAKHRQSFHNDDDVEHDRDQDGTDHVPPEQSLSDTVADPDTLRGKVVNLNEENDVLRKEVESLRTQLEKQKEQD